MWHCGLMARSLPVSKRAPYGICCTRDITIVWHCAGITSFYLLFFILLEISGRRVFFLLEMEAASPSETFETICKSARRHKQGDCSFSAPFFYNYVIILYHQIRFFRPLQVTKISPLQFLVVYTSFRLKAMILKLYNPSVKTYGLSLWEKWFEFTWVITSKA
jgi:hypothetical protein